MFQNTIYGLLFRLILNSDYKAGLDYFTPVVPRHMLYVKTKEKISDFVASAPKKYKVYTIPKKSSGTRTIAQPSKRMKDYQRSLVKLLETKLPVHDAAFCAQFDCTTILISNYRTIRKNHVRH